MENKKLKIASLVFILLVYCLWQVFTAPCGDVNSNGTINIIDALMTAQYYVGLNPEGFDLAAADVSGDSVIDIVDALLTAQYYVGLITSFPGCAPTPTPPGPAGPAGYTYCADEGETITFDYLVDAAYGADGSFNYLYGVTGAITFDNDTFGDPIPGTVKYGFYKAAGPTPDPTPTFTPEPTGSTQQPSGDAYTPNGFGRNATGGGNASPTTVTSASAFKSAVSGSSAKVIIINGLIDLGGNVNIGSNTTLKGANSSSGLYGGVIHIQGSNYIIQNLTFGPSGDDVMEILEATDVFITKCTFHDSSDELCSIVKGSDYVTVSWCRFYFDSPDSHSFAHLIGGSDSDTGDRGKLHVTFHHNWYDNGVRGRQPRVRFGQVHLYNLYHNSNNTNNCIGIGTECHIRLENSHFDNVNAPWANYGGSSNGEIGWSDVKFEGCSQPTFMSNSYPVFDLPYSYSMHPVDSVEAIVRAGAGNVF